MRRAELPLWPQSLWHSYICVVHSGDGSSEHYELAFAKIESP